MKITLLTLLLSIGLLSINAQNAWIHTYVKVKTHWDPSQNQLEFYSCVKDDATTNGTAFNVTNVVSSLSIGGTTQSYTLNSIGTFPVAAGPVSFVFTATNPVTGNVYSYDATISVDAINPVISYNVSPTAPHNLPMSLLVTSKASTPACDGEVDLNISGGYPFVSSTNPYGTSWYPGSIIVANYHEDSLANLCAGNVQYKFADDWDCGSPAAACLLIDTLYSYYDTATMSSVVYASMYPYMDQQYLDTVIYDSIYNGCIAFNCSSSFFCDDVDVEVWECPNLNTQVQSCMDYEIYGSLPVGTLSADGSVFNPVNPGFYGQVFPVPFFTDIVFTHATGAVVNCPTFSSIVDLYPTVSSIDESCDSLNGTINFTSGYEDVFADYGGSGSFMSFEYTYQLSDSVGNIVSTGTTLTSTQIDSLEAGNYMVDFYGCPGSSYLSIPITVGQDTLGCATQSCYSGYVICMDTQDPVDNAPVNLSVDGGVTVYSDSLGFFSYCKSTGAGGDSIATVDVDETWYSSNGYFNDGASLDIVFLEESQSITDASNNTLLLNCSSQGVGIESLAGVQIRLFPNPTSNVLNIITSDLVNQIQVVDMNGRVVMTKVHTNLNTTLNISELEAGYYSIRFIGDTGIAHRQFIKM